MGEGVNQVRAFPFIRVVLALLLAIQVWTWLRLAGAIWLSGAFEHLAVLVKSVGPLKISLEAFWVLVVPTLAVSFWVQRVPSMGGRVLAYTVLGAAVALLDLISNAGFNWAFIGHQLWVYLISGGVAGLAYGAMLELRWRARPAVAGEGALSEGRRNLLGTLGVSLGGAGLLGSLAGPLYVWRNRHRYIDVNLGHLKEDQLMTLTVANKPVWILRRSPEVIRLLEQENPQLFDPHSEHSQQPEQAKNGLRSIRPEYFIAYGICTHLGCAPVYSRDGEGNEGADSSAGPQFFCPCHGGLFDLAGRVYSGTPPPANLVVPAHSFVSAEVVRLYFPSLAEAWRG